MPFIRRILCIDDDPDALRVLAEYLAIEGYEVIVAPDGASGIQLLTLEDVQLVITDLNMPGLSGMDVIDIVRKNYPHLQIMVVTGYGTIESVLEALHKGAIDYLVKPYLLEILKLSLGKAERQIEIEERLRRAEEAGAAPESARLLEALPIPTALLGSNRRPLMCNSRFEQIFGAWRGSGPEGLAPRLQKRLLDFLDTRGGEDSLLLNVSRDGGRERVLELDLLPLQEGDGHALLQASEVNLNEPPEEDGLEEAVLLISPNGAVLWANGVGVDWFGLVEEDVPTLADLLGETLEPEQLVLLCDPLPATAAFQWSGRLKRRSAGQVQVKIMATPFLDERLRRCGTVLCLRASDSYTAPLPFDRRHQAESGLALMKVGAQGRIRWVSDGFSRQTNRSEDQILQHTLEDVLSPVVETVSGHPGPEEDRLDEVARVSQSDGLLVEVRPRDLGPLALDIEEQKAKLARTTSVLSHLLSAAGSDDQTRLRERLDEVAGTLVQSGNFRRAALYVRDGEAVLGWGFAGYPLEEEVLIRDDPAWRARCETVEDCCLRLGTASLIRTGAGKEVPVVWEPGCFLTLPILDRHQMEVGRLRLEESVSGLLPNAAQVHIIDLILRHVALSLDELELERQVARSEARYHDLYENAKYSIMVVDTENGRVVDVNREAEKLTGHERGELVGKRIWEIQGQEHVESARRNWMRILQRETTVFENVPLRRKDGNTVYVEYNCMFSEFNGRPVVQSFYRDVTEKQALEFSLIQSQKLAGLGQLSAGVAHELRNPLGIMNSSLFYINSIFEKEELKLPDQIRKHLGIIKNEVDRSRKIIENLLSFSRVSSQEREAVDLIDLLRATLDLVKKELLVNNIRLVTEFAELPQVYLNLDELKQAFLNIILNATQAMPDGGMLRIRARLEGGRILISFEDTGQGISKDNLPNVLNPFFTTKEPGMGTGLGLSITHSFIRRAGGDLTLESELGIGTTVRIQLTAPGIQEHS